MTKLRQFPSSRVRSANRSPLRAERGHVLYWMTANRRLEWNFALQRAVDRAQELDLPLLILEGLRPDYPWACDRFHRFVMQGMADKLRRLRGSGVGYYPYVEPEHGAGRRLLAKLSVNAALVVTDEIPGFIYPAMLRRAAESLDVLLEAVDSAGLMPVGAAGRDFDTAYSFRRFLQQQLPPHLDALPDAEPLRRPLPRLDVDLATLVNGYRPTGLEELESPQALAALPIDHGVAPVSTPGVRHEAGRRLQRLVDDLLGNYGQRRHHPDSQHTSELSAFLHFGLISSHEIFATIAAEETWTPVDLSADTRGMRHGWWGMSPGAEAFLDQLVTWRELGFSTCRQRADHDRYSSLPAWAQATLDDHRDDVRDHEYTIAELEAATTHDEIWNAAQRELAVEGRIHSYLRMLWGKNILAWSTSPEEALRVMIELNNKYALDGRDPNSYSGIFWVLGRYDRPWGPERPVFGKVRYMTSASAARKLRLRAYVARYSPNHAPPAEAFA